MPKDLAAFVRATEELRAHVSKLLAAGRTLVEQVERLVCALYSVPDELTEAVVEHAVRRAER